MEKKTLVNSKKYPGGPFGKILQKICENNCAKIENLENIKNSEKYINFGKLGKNTLENLEPASK